MTKITNEYVWVFDTQLFKRDIISKFNETGWESLTDMSELLGYSSGWLSNLGTGEHHSPGMRKFLEICDQLDLRPLDYFTVERVFGTRRNDHYDDIPF